MKDYKKILEGVVNIVNAIENSDICFDTIRAYISENCPELKKNEDERIRKEILDYIDKSTGCKRWVAWLEKQGKPIDEEKVLIGARKDAALSIMKFLDRCTLGMCLSNMECADLEDAVVNSDWSKVYNYMKKKLEKQCEKPQGKTTLEDVNEEKFDNANKVEPKFNLYDWVVTDKGDTVQIVAVNNGYYTLHNGMDFNMSYVDKCWRKWTIQDAKDGDVLAAHECLVLFREIDGLNIRCYCTYHFMNNPSFYVDTLQNKDAFHPATKEQCDTLMKAMDNAGYTFNFEKKVLKNIDKNPEETSISLNDFQEAFELKARQYDIELPNRGYDIHAMCKELYSMLTEQKPTWSEEDKDFMYDTISNLTELKDRYGEGYGNVGKCIDWLKSIKERYTWNPSDEQIKVCKEVYADLLSAKGFDVGTINSELNRLEEKLK